MTFMCDCIEKLHKTMVSSQRHNTYTFHFSFSTHSCWSFQLTLAIRKFCTCQMKSNVIHSNSIAKKTKKNLP